MHEEIQNHNNSETPWKRNHDTRKKSETANYDTKEADPGRNYTKGESKPMCANLIIKRQYKFLTEMPLRGRRVGGKRKHMLVLKDDVTRTKLCIIRTSISQL